MQFGPLDLDYWMPGNLTLVQKRLFAVAGAAVVVFLWFIFFVYIPGSNAVKMMQIELVNAERQIKEIEESVGKDKSLNEGVRLLQERYQELDSKFPSREERSLKILSLLARNFDIRIVSINPAPKSDLLDDDNRPVAIGQRTCRVMAVSLDIYCSYKDLVQYLQALQESSPALITFERIKITKDRLGTKKLNITLDLNLYLLI